MRPVKTAESNLVYNPPGGMKNCDPLHCVRVERGLIKSTWTLTDAERATIAAGGNIDLWIFNEPIPPVALTMSAQPEVDE